MNRQKAVRALWVAAGVPLTVGAVAGLALSFGNVVDVVRPIVGDDLAPVFPLVWDVILLGSALAFLATAYAGKPRAMWRVISIGGAVATCLVNATAAHDVRTMVVHLSGPLGYALLVEAGASQLRAGHRAKSREWLGESVPFRLWVTAPIESGRVWLRMARRVEGEQAAARVEVGAYAAAVEALRVSVPGRGGRRVRAILTRQLRAGTLTPGAVLTACGWTGPGQDRDPAQRVLRVALGSALGQAPDVVDDQGDELDPVAVSVVVDEGRPELLEGLLDARAADLQVSVTARPEPVQVEEVPAPEPALEAEIPAPQSRPSPLAAANARTGELLVEALALMASGPPPGADPRPVAAARAERPVTATLPAGDGGDDVDPLLTAAGQVAADLTAAGRRVTRAALLDGLRDRRHSCSTARGSQLLAQLRACGSA